MDPLTIVASAAEAVFGRDFAWNWLPDYARPGAGVLRQFTLDVEFFSDAGQWGWCASVAYRAYGLTRVAVAA